MSKDRLTKKQLSSNELQDALEGARDYVVSHAVQTRHYAMLGAAGVALVALVWGGLYLRSRSLQARFSSALSLYDAPLVTDGVPAVAGGKVFKDAAERTQAVQKELKGIAEDSPSSLAGEASRLILLASAGGKPPAALVDAARDFAKGESGSIAGGMAAQSYLDAVAAAGGVKEAIDMAKKYLDSSSLPLPKDALIFTLAQLYEKNGQTTEAKTFYQRVVSDFPDSPMRFDAQQKVQGL